MSDSALALSLTDVVVEEIRESADAHDAHARDASVASVAHTDDLSREVYCILGIPIDAIEMQAVVRSIEAAAAARAAPFVLSTPNVNFLVKQSGGSGVQGVLVAQRSLSG